MGDKDVGETKPEANAATPSDAATPVEVSAAAPADTPQPDPAASAGPQSTSGVAPEEPVAKPVNGTHTLSTYVIAKRESSRVSRLSLIAATVALAAGIGSILGSLGYAAIERNLMRVESPRIDIVEDVRALKTEVAQLRTHVKSAADQVASLRTAVINSGAATNAQFTKLTEALERSDKRAAMATASPEVTGSIVKLQPPAPPIRPIPGWIVRRVYDGVALIENRTAGIIEVEAGATLGNLGRVQEIKRENGRWMVVTSKGVITSR